MEELEDEVELVLRVDDVQQPRGGETERRVSSAGHLWRYTWCCVATGEDLLDDVGVTEFLQERDFPDGRAWHPFRFPGNQKVQNDMLDFDITAHQLKTSCVWILCPLRFRLRIRWLIKR